MTLTIETQSPGSKIINLSGDNIIFSIDINNGIADITALGYLVNVTMSGTVANVQWYRSYTGTLEYYTFWNSQEGLTVTGASIRQEGNYLGGCSLHPTGFNPVNDPSSSPANFAWYTGSSAGGNYFLGFTFRCPKTGYYSIATSNMWLGANADIPAITIAYNATVTTHIAGQSSPPSSASYSGAIDQKMTEHTGITIPSIVLISGSSYIFNFDVDIELTDLSSDPGSSARWTLSLGDPDNPPTKFYTVTGTA